MPTLRIGRVEFDIWRDGVPLQSQDGLDQAAQASSGLAMTYVRFDLVF
jgi:hypothetical protein